MWLLLFALVGTDVQAVGAVRAATRSVAILSAGGRTAVAGPGESAFGLTVVAVTAEGVLVDHGGIQVVLPLRGGPSRNVPLPAGDGAQRVDRAALIAQLARERVQLVTETTVAPWPGGGLAVARVDPSGLLSRLGLLPGDVVLDIDGVPVGGVSDVAALVRRLPTATAVAVGLRREGRRLVLRFSLQ